MLQDQIQSQRPVTLVIEVSHESGRIPSPHTLETVLGLRSSRAANRGEGTSDTGSRSGDREVGTTARRVTEHLQAR